VRVHRPSNHMERFPVPTRRTCNGDEILTREQLDVHACEAVEEGARQSLAAASLLERVLGGKEAEAWVAVVHLAQLRDEDLEGGGGEGGGRVRTWLEITCGRMFSRAVEVAGSRAVAVAGSRAIASGWRHAQQGSGSDTPCLAQK
jgi:hypothetical protein